MAGWFLRKELVMNQRLAILSRIVLLAAVLGGAGIVDAQTHTHSWYFQNIFAIVDTGSNYTHRIDGQQRCSICGATRYASAYENHGYQFIWYSYNQYSSTQHEYKRDDRCSACGHVKHTSQLQAHQCESIYDTYCNLCGYSNVRMCG
jgi:hypothetical protein